jgi:hypothetical protein
MKVAPAVVAVSRPVIFPSHAAADPSETVCDGEPGGRRIALVRRIPRFGGAARGVNPWHHRGKASPDPNPTANLVGTAGGA